MNTNLKNSSTSSQPGPDDRQWRAFYVKPRHEKKVSSRLDESGYEVYCPLREAKVKWSDRWKKVKKPLINGYVFARVSERERLEAVKDPGVLRTVFWKGEPARIRDEEIETMKKLLELGGEARVDSLKPGDRVKVTEGGHTLGIKGLEGIVVQDKGRTVSLHLESLRMQLSVTLPSQMVTKIEKDGPGEAS